MADHHIHDGHDGLWLVSEENGGLVRDWTDEDEARWAAEQEARDAKSAEMYRSAARPGWWLTPEDNAIPPASGPRAYDDGYAAGLRAGVSSDMTGTLAGMILAWVAGVILGAWLL